MLIYIVYIISTFIMLHFRYPDIVANVDKTETLKKMKSWRKKIVPEAVPETYLEFRNALYLRGLRVLRGHSRGVLRVDAVMSNDEEATAIVFYDRQLLRQLSTCTDLYVTSTRRTLPRNMDNTLQLVSVVAVYRGIVRIFF